VVELLFELGTEELPARFVGPALADLERSFRERAAAAGLPHGSVRRFGTPRRLALLVDGVVERTNDAVKEVLGPSVKAAFDAEGQPRVPAVKFAESVKLPVGALKRVQTPKGEYLAAEVAAPGRFALELLPEILGACVHGLGFPKSMRWGDVEFAFGRPLHWMVALLGTEVVPVVFADVRSGRETYGHRFLAPAAISLARPEDYEPRLERAFVVADVTKRRALVLERVEAAAKAAGGTLIADEALVEQVTNLVELPSPLVGTFDERHLDLPPEVLIQEMKSHQRYFSLQGPDGKLMSKFIAVSNTPVRDEALSRRGYERVLRARLSDGRFFYDEDRRTRLADRIPKLARVVWNRDLNSTYAQKIERFGALARWLALASRGALATPQFLADIARASALSKADLVTGMVGEFPELQGVMGREYALHDRESREVAVAIFEHYLPRGATDGLPTRDEGALVGLADRFDSLVGIFAAGKRPTGAADPFGLRRACLAIINITLGRGYHYSLGATVDEALRLLQGQLAGLKQRPSDAQVREQVLDFFRGRLEALWREAHRADLVEAVLSAVGGFDDLVAAAARLQALSQAVRRGGFESLAATFKRVANIVDKQARDVSRACVDPAKLVEPAEHALVAELGRVREAVTRAVGAGDYAQALGHLAPLKPFVDTFFDRVMVMAEDRSLRENRVRILMDISALFGALADFSRIQSES
jgi:glycyl-tRNA synthetase beta chain